jgi:hypothetical protein
VLDQSSVLLDSLAYEEDQTQATRHESKAMLPSQLLQKIENKRPNQLRSQMVIKPNQFTSLP